MVGLREHIDEAKSLQSVSPLIEETEIPCEGSRVARDINDFFGF